jgi:maleate isomerase
MKRLTRLGLIIPSSNTTMEREFCEMLPSGFSLHAARVRLNDVTRRGLVQMEKRTEEEARKLGDAQVEGESHRS